jgi:aminoglycoside 2''-phosphotransferase
MAPDWRQIEVENRSLSVQSVRFLGEGWHSRAYLVNEDLVFRFPKRLEQWEELDREIRFLVFVADKLPLAVPRYLRAAPDSSAAAYGYAVYPYLRGNAMEINGLSREKRTAAADRIAVFLRTLHGLVPGSEVGSLLPRVDARLVAEQFRARAEREIVPKLRPLEAKVLRQQFESYLGTPGNFLFRPVVRHADLGRSHVLMEDDSIVAIIDFGGVSWGDADFDFMPVFSAFGEAFAEEVAQRYGHHDLEQLKMKLRYFDLGDQIDIILNGVGRALESQEDAAWSRLEQILQTWTR